LYSTSTPLGAAERQSGKGKPPGMAGAWLAGFPQIT